MFRLYENVPEVYANKSRDFQLFCRLYDACFNGVKFTTDSLLRSTVTRECDARLLELLKTKLGLFTSVSLEEHELRCLLDAFPILIRYKGSRKGVKYITTLFMKMYPEMRSASVEIKNFPDYTVKFFFSTLPENDKILFELCKYMLPPGYIVTYTVSEVTSHKSSLAVTETVNYENTNDENTDDPLKGRVEFSSINNSQTNKYPLVGVATIPEIDTSVFDNEENE